MTLEQENKSAVWIAQSLRRRIEGRLARTDFKTVDDYVGYVVEQVLGEVEKQDAPEDAADEQEMSKEDQEVLEQRLRDLGYL